MAYLFIYENAPDLRLSLIREIFSISFVNKIDNEVSFNLLRFLNAYIILGSAWANVFCQFLYCTDTENNKAPC